ncbi:phosphate signaling complex protein PhoU [Tichowtungia aerotolerans]|uniref:Phosphate-specific transport system accessory protein PhoU n=1 Tax=Tichowtungia aerotolerans TaxID=2697043 RepID=A0A6P1MBF7_9BACT|nr:phosphate signaling complex protein PhoU [Tichowtungia aerotolerans]QHI70433.1 phosphate signaling complex protein PhoU [Tichowtungia aerotolerans]
MSQVFVHEIDKLKKRILSLSAQVEENVVLAVKALVSRDEALARQIIDSDSEIDRQEVEVEEEALKILALYQPVAMDLRFLTTVLKINNDLERIGDLAVNIAKRALQMCEQPEVRIPPELDEVALKARDMVRRSLTAFVNLDAEMANEVREADDEVDVLCKQVSRFVAESGRKNPEHLGIYLTMLLASRNLERVGDHATNVAEDVVYLVDGVIVRHKPYEERA